MKKVLSVLSVATLSLSLVLAGCGSKEAQPQGQTGGNGGATGSASTIKVGMVTDVGGVNDNSFNQSAWEGLQKLQTELNLPKDNVNYLQSTSDAEYVPNLTQFVKDKWDLTWGIGFLMGDHLKKVASENPDSKLAIIDAEVDAPNVESVLFKEHEGSFLAGVVAAKMTKTKKVGFVGGVEIPVIKRFDLGFEAGVKAVDPSIQVIKVYTGAFDKPDVGKSTASSIYGQGADIIFHASGGTGDGVFNEAKDRKAKGQDVWVIGVDKDQSLTFGDDITLTSMVKRVDEAVFLVSKDLTEGKFDGGKIKWLGLAEDGVGLAATSTKNVPEDVLKLVDEYKQKIVKGEITVPDK
ncbi:BMP family ABC transporter substrate-binding protein [Brevibacillus reuszeri]|uniref:BMP family ABC transporter substrate-binding protein n=1 Tax=Brevibacillus reuszeri TaxID=54915 RepID=A0A0K9YVW4_9BACL|nr:BMP family protein [Brevibacillus reuszeri]KNB72792.1 CD4+ T-cell-stimulating antigen [Brevibacillus reuszeri]MED1860503.1 BMP family protein [Brevibacillus reuszeri]GED70172.1 BMP family ABC transporter substrate-binding protein [Brevibacillus reuszeri]